LKNAAKTWKPTLRARVSDSSTLCNVSSMEWLSGTKFVYCSIHSATDHILEDTSHSSYSVLLGSIFPRVSLSQSSVSSETCTSMSVVKASHWSSCNKTHNNEDTFKEQDGSHLGSDHIAPSILDDCHVVPSPSGSTVEKIQPLDTAWHSRGLSSWTLLWEPQVSQN
jgi:hypothetical protein